jgi:FG-GAP repeat
MSGLVRGFAIRHGRTGALAVALVCTSVMVPASVAKAAGNQSPSKPPVGVGQQVAKLKGKGADGLGCSVAISGSLAAAGAPGADGSNGAVNVYTTTGKREATLTASDGASGDNLGCAVAMSGTTVVAGASAHNSNTGAVYVFTQSGSSWTQQAELTASDAATDDFFGGAVAIDGDTLLVSSSQDSGVVYVFTGSGSSWTQQAELPAPAGSIGCFGCSVALSGTTAIIGDPDLSHPTAGAAYVFTQSGSSWTQQAELTSSDGANGDGFGYSVSISGQTALVGAPFHGPGAAYVFTEVGSTWSQQAELTPPGGESGDEFGASVATTGTAAVVGDPYTGSDGAGATYVFSGSGSSWSSGVVVDQKITKDAGAALGYSVGVSGSLGIEGAVYYKEKARGGAAGIGFIFGA